MSLDGLRSQAFNPLVRYGSSPVLPAEVFVLEANYLAVRGELRKALAAD